MHDAVSVGVIEGGQHRQRDLHHLRGRQPAVFGQEGPKVRSTNELHHHEVGVVGRAPVVHADDVRVIEDRGGPSLATEPIDESAIPGQVRMEDLDGDLAPQDGVVRPKDLTHPAGGDAGDDLIAAVDGCLDHGQGA